MVSVIFMMQISWKGFLIYHSSKPTGLSKWFTVTLDLQSLFPYAWLCAVTSSLAQLDL